MSLPGAEATLLLARTGTGALRAAQTLLLGLPLLRRTALAAGRAGFERVYVLGAGDEKTESVLEGTGARPFPREGAESALPPGRIVLLPESVVASPRWLRIVREAPAEAGRLHRFGAGAIVETAEPAPLARSAANDSRLSSVMSGWAATLAPGRDVSTVPPPFELAADGDVPAAEKMLLKELVKPADSILTKLISRKISLAVTRRVARTSITPNMMTLFCIGLGLAAALSFVSPALPRQIVGGVLFLLHSILDGCDGELARLKFRESRLGGTLDFAGDNVVHVAVFSAFAVAWRTAVGQDWPLVLGALAVSGTVLSAGFVYLYAMRPRQGGGPLLAGVSPLRRSRLSQALDTASGRDFIYLVMVLALFGKAYWFLAAAAVGTPGFFLGLLVMALAARRSDQRDRRLPATAWTSPPSGR